MRHFTLVLLSALLVACAAPKPRLGNGTVAPLSDKPRVVVTTDPELDDSNSLLRYLLYSTDFRTEGLVYASSQFHWKGDGTGKLLSVPNREYTRFGLSICPCESWRWAPGERFIWAPSAHALSAGRRTRSALSRQPRTAGLRRSSTQ